jgi:hypothetical protein
MVRTDEARLHLQVSRLTTSDITCLLYVSSWKTLQRRYRF